MKNKYFIESDKEVIENIISVAESLDFSVVVYPYKDEKKYNIEFSKYSTAGRDFSFNIDIYSDSTESDIAQKIYDYYEDFDVSYETYIYLDNFGHGINGAPDDMIDVYNDTKECESFIDELASAINNKEF